MVHPEILVWHSLSVREQLHWNNSGQHSLYLVVLSHTWETFSGSLIWRAFGTLETHGDAAHTWERGPEECGKPYGWDQYTAEFVCICVAGGHVRVTGFDWTACVSIMESKMDEYRLPVPCASQLLSICECLFHKPTPTHIPRGIALHLAGF